VEAPVATSKPELIEKPALMLKLPPADLPVVAPAEPVIPAAGDVPPPPMPPAPPGPPPVVLPSDAPPLFLDQGHPGSAPGGFYGGAGLLFLTPYVSNNTAFTLTTPPTPPPPGAFPVAIGSAQNANFEWAYGQAVQAWVGWTHPSGWGVRVDTFAFDQGSDTLTAINGPGLAAPRLITVPGVIPAIPGAAAFGSPSSVLAGAGLGTDRLLFNSDLEIRSFDAEGTYQLGGPDYVVRLSAGIRGQSIRQRYHATLRNPGDGVTMELQRLEFAQDFSGGGPTIGLFARHSIFDCLAAYVNARGAILAGHVTQRGEFYESIQDPLLAAFVGSQQTQTRFDNKSDQVVTYGEIEFGLEYGVCIGHANLFLRAGIVGQAYGNAGNATGGNGTLGLLGGQVAAGLNY
jgi:hypothetical protein